MTDIDDILDDAFTKVMGDAFTGAGRILRQSRAKLIVKQEAYKMGLCQRDIMAYDRTRPAVIARQAAMYRIAAELGWSLSRIGQFLGGRDHTTIHHGIRAHERRMKEESNA